MYDSTYRGTLRIKITHMHEYMKNDLCSDRTHNLEILSIWERGDPTKATSQKSTKDQGKIAGPHSAIDN
jgi:hypothetical protein